MSIISLRVPEDEIRIFKSYAKLNNCSLSELIRTTLLDRIEDEFDAEVFAEYEEELEKGTVKTRSFEELEKELGF